MGAVSAGILVYRREGPQTSFLLGHPGGPLWARKDLGAWMVPKGLIEPDEAPADAAIREFREETGLEPPPVAQALSALRQAGGKTVLCWAAEGDLDLRAFAPGRFEMEWPATIGHARFISRDRSDRLLRGARRFAQDPALPSAADPPSPRVPGRGRLSPCGSPPSTSTTSTSGWTTC